MFLLCQKCKLILLMARGASGQHTTIMPKQKLDTRRGVYLITHTNLSFLRENAGHTTMWRARRTVRFIVRSAVKFLISTRTSTTQSNAYKFERIRNCKHHDFRHVKLLLVCRNCNLAIVPVGAWDLPRRMP